MIEMKNSFKIYLINVIGGIPGSVPFLNPEKYTCYVTILFFFHYTLLTDI